MCVCVSHSVVSDSVIPWTVARQAPLSVEFSRQEYWSELPFPSPGALPNPGIKPGSPTLQADSLPSEPPRKLSITAKSLQSCPTLCDPRDHSLPGSSVHGISQARILEWVAIPFFRGSSRPRDWTCISCIGRQALYC